VNQKFGNVEKQKTIFTGSNFEAIIGMAYPALAKPGVKPIFDEIMDQHLLKSNIFAFYFTTKQAEDSGIYSDMTFGYYDKEKFKGEIAWHPVEFKYMFGVKLDDVKVNGKALNICADQHDGCLITFDSGTSLMSFPTWAADKMKDHGYPTADHVIPCRNKE
jgi:saccharopepsin